MTSFRHTFTGGFNEMPNLFVYQDLNINPAGFEEYALSSINFVEYAYYAHNGI